MKTTTRQQVAAVTIVLTAAVGTFIATAHRAPAIVALPQIVITAQRLPVHQLSAVIVTGKRLHDNTRLAATNGTNAAS